MSFAGHPRPALQARSVPLRARRHPVQVPPPDVAGELRGRPRLPRPAVPGGQRRAAGASSTRRSAGSPARRWTAAGRCGRCTSSRAWPTAGSPCWARSTTRWPTASRRRICWRAGWTCRTGPQADRDSYATDPAPTQVELVRTAFADHMRQIGRLPGVMRYTAQGVQPGAQELDEAVARADPAVHAAADVHEPQGRRAAQVRHRDAGARRRQGDRQAPGRHNQRHGARDLGGGAASTVAASTTVTPITRCWPPSQ